MAEVSDLTIPLEKLSYIVLKAREYDVKEEVSEPDPGSNSSDDGMVSVLEDHGDDPVRKELVTCIRELNEDEQIDLVALVWLGRGDGDAEDWEELREQARQARNKRTARYLLGIPMLGDLIEEGVDKLGGSLAEIESETI